MLGTKLKNNRKLTIVLILLSIVIPVFIIMGQYWNWYVNAEVIKENSDHSAVVSEEFLETFLDAGYILYNMENGRDRDPEVVKEILQQNSGRMSAYERIYPFLDYRVKDEDGNDVAKSTADSERTVGENNLSSFALGMVITYDEYGNIDVQIEEGEYKAEQSIAFREIISEYDSDWAVDIFNEETGEWETIRLEKPKNRTYIYAMTKENLETYIGNCGYTFNYVAETMVDLFVLLILVVAALAWLLPVLPVWYQKDMKILRAPLEVTVLVFCVMTAILGENLWWIAARAAGRADFVDFIIWTFVFAVTFWAATCLRQVYTLGVGTYLKERTLCVRYWQYIRKAWIYIVGKIREWIGQCYHFIDRIDLSEKSNQTIFKIVAVNFIVLALICSMWIGGLFLLGIYSAVLFWLLRKYFNELQEKYAVLFKATGEIAKGNLDVEIVEDLGI